ncbi:hypothetical protein GCM10027046_27870 [Uliginosibacterium flavum]
MIGKSRGGVWIDCIRPPKEPLPVELHPACLCELVARAGPPRAALQGAGCDYSCENRTLRFQLPFAPAGARATS